MRRSILLGGGALATAALLGCGNGDEMSRAIDEDLPRPEADRSQPLDTAYRPISKELRGAGAPGQGARLVDRQRLEGDPLGPEGVAPTALGGPEGEVYDVSFSVRQASAEQVIRALVHDTLGRPYIIDPTLAQASERVTLEVREQMSEKDIMDLLGSLAGLHGWSIEQQSNTLMFSQAQRMPRSPATPIMQARSALPGADAAARLFRMRYVSPEEVMSACEPLMSEGSTALVAGNTLMLVDRTDQLNRLGRLIRQLDAPPFEGSEVWTYQLAHATPEKISGALNQMASGTALSGGADSSAVSFVPIPDRSRLMVVSRNPQAQRTIRRWVELLDQPAEGASRQRFVYRVQNYETQPLSRLLEQTFADKMERDPQDPGDRGVRITADSEENTLICYATPGDYAEMLELLQEIDKPRQQVQITATVAEVTLRNNLEYGVEYFLETDAGENLILDSVVSATGLGPAAPVGALTLAGTSGLAVIQALEEESDVRVLSRPRVLVRDREIAQFQVGGEVPIITASIDSRVQEGGDTGIRQDIEFRDTGIIVDLEPRVNESGEVRLKITLEVTDVVPNTTSGIDSPEFTVRLIDTSVTVPHDSTLLLAGLIEQDTTDRENSVPLLGDIPVLGNAFKNVTREEQRTELILTVTPRIVNRPQNASALYDEMLEQTVALREALAEFGDNPLPPNGAAPGRESPAPRERDVEPEQDPAQDGDVASASESPAAVQELADVLILAGGPAVTPLAEQILGDTGDATAD